MQRLFLLIMLFPLVAGACAWEVGSRASFDGHSWEVKSESTDSNGDRIVYRVSSTRAQWFNPKTGAITTDIEVVNNQLHGEYRAYDHTTGERIMIGHFENDKRRGVWMAFDSTGAVASLLRADAEGNLSGVCTATLDVFGRNEDQSLRVAVTGVSISKCERMNSARMEAEEIGRVEAALDRFAGTLEIACIGFAKELEGEEQTRVLRYGGFGDEEIRKLRAAAIIP